MPNILKELLHHEQVLQFNRFDSEIAWRLGSWIVNKVRTESLPVAFDITLSGRCLFHYSSNDASLDNEGWIERKKRTVERFKHSSYYMGRLLAEKGRSALEEFYVEETVFCFHGGAFPIILKGTGPVGIITVSGLTEREDHNLAVAGLAWALRKKDEVSPIL
ncbi:MAG: heme-degrading domain-containing protein [Sphaerochaetaceae bacterium]